MFGVVLFNKQEPKVIEVPKIVKLPKKEVIEQKDVMPQDISLGIHEKFRGKWTTHKGKNLEGIMTCIVKTADQEKWWGVFYGEWNGVEFSYDVVWTGPMDNLVGTAVVDGVPYTWTGEITKKPDVQKRIGGTFKGTFKSDRYDGFFNLHWVDPLDAIR